MDVAYTSRVSFLNGFEIVFYGLYDLFVVRENSDEDVEEGACRKTGIAQLDREMVGQSTLERIVRQNRIEVVTRQDRFLVDVGSSFALHNHPQIEFFVVVNGKIIHDVDFVSVDEIDGSAGVGRGGAVLADRGGAGDVFGESAAAEFDELELGVVVGLGSVWFPRKWEVGGCLGAGGAGSGNVDASGHVGVVGVVVGVFGE